MLYDSGSQPGVCVPIEVREELIGGTQNVKTHSKEAHLGRIFDLGVCKKDTALIWGCAEETFLIWGYASTKRLRTPALWHIFLQYDFGLMKSDEWFYSSIIVIFAHCLCLLCKNEVLWRSCWIMSIQFSSFKNIQNRAIEPWELFW